jgi:hypothetical protein
LGDGQSNGFGSLQYDNELDIHHTIASAVQPDKSSNQQFTPKQGTSYTDNARSFIGFQSGIALDDDSKSGERCKDGNCTKSSTTPEVRGRYRSTFECLLLITYRRFDFWKNIHIADIFPLALAVVLVVEQTVFLAVQASSLESVLVSGCSGIAQIMFPGISDRPRMELLRLTSCSSVYVWVHIVGVWHRNNDTIFW